ncbi:hypothetical protein BGX24_003518 [Mortierella sp. AD032]|nr:hypothetical protein BGX24_003518 [Mortierella sp. AD032]
MGQSFNLQGILQSFRVLTSPRLMVPNIVVRDIRDINFEQLHKSGIVAIAFDKDNCLTKPYGLELHPPFQDAWRRCRKVYKDQVVIVSNSAGTPDDKDNQQAQAIEQALQVNVLRHQEKKPSGGQELLNHFSGIKAARIAFVGDRALTDVVFGNNYGLLTILTRDVVTEEGDNPMALRIRRLEHRVLAFLDRMNIKAQPHPIPIDLHAVVLQAPPPPESKEEAKADIAAEETRNKEAKESEERKAKFEQSKRAQKMTTHPSSNTGVSSTAATTTGTPATAAAHTGQTASSQTGTVGSTEGFSTQVEPQILSHEQGTGWERTITQVPGEEPVHSIKLAGHIKGIPGRR